MGIIVTTLLCIPIGRLWGDATAIHHTNATVVSWQGFFDAPDFSVLLKLDLFGSLKLALFPVIFTILFTDMFDTIATFMGGRRSREPNRRVRGSA